MAWYQRPVCSAGCSVDTVTWPGQPGLSPVHCRPPAGSAPHHVPATRHRSYNRHGDQSGTNRNGEERMDCVVELVAGWTGGGTREGCNCALVCQCTGRISVTQHWIQLQLSSNQLHSSCATTNTVSITPFQVISSSSQ